MVRVLSILMYVSCLFAYRSEALCGLFAMYGGLGTSILISLIDNILAIVVILLLMRFAPLNICTVTNIDSIFVNLGTVMFIPLCTTRVLGVGLAACCESVFEK